MTFQFLKSDTMLTTAAASDGCGLTTTQVGGITEQKYADYMFGYHTMYHGSAQQEYVYVMPVGIKPSADVCRIFINGAKAGTTAGGCNLLGNKSLKDAKAVVAANQALFLAIAGTRH